MIKPTCDSKTRFRKSQRNTYGLLPGPQGSCPKATIGVGGCSQIEKGRKNPTCYVFNVMSAYKGVRPVLQANTDALMAADHDGKVKMLTAEFARFKRLEMKQDEPSLYYRLHWSGDIYSKDYADALSCAMGEFPEITFWNYTRNMMLAPALAEATPNLVQYLSLDAINIEGGLIIYNMWLKSNPKVKNIHLCYMSKENDFKARYDKLREQYPKWPEKAPHLVGCPADLKNIKSEGSCAKCKRCMKGGGVWFKTK